MIILKLFPLAKFPEQTPWWDWTVGLSHLGIDQNNFSEGNSPWEKVKVLFLGLSDSMQEAENTKNKEDGVI